MHRISARLAVFPIAAILLASSAGGVLAQEPVTVTDSAGNDITITDASSVVTLGGVTTEIVYALGAQDHVVAVDDSSYYPPEALAEKPTIGYHRMLSAEPILGVAPTLIIGDDTSGPPDVLSQLRDAGITTLLLTEPKSLDKTRSSITTIGHALGFDAAAEQVVATLDEQVATAADLVSTATSTPRVLFFFMPPGAPSLISGTGTAADAMITLAGGVNAIDGYEGYLPMTPEAIAQAAPDVILTTDASLTDVGGVDGLMGQPGIAETPAAANGRIVTMDDLYLLGFGPRTGLAIADLAGLLHPELASQ